MSEFHQPIPEEPNNSENKTPEEIEVIEGRESFDIANGANVPVNVMLVKEIARGTDNETGYFFLGADNYMPRKDRVQSEMFGVRAKDPEVLRQIVAQKIVPLYERALADLQGIVNGTSESLYYWDPPNSPEEPDAQPQTP